MNARRKGRASPYHYLCFELPAFSRTSSLLCNFHLGKSVTLKNYPKNSSKINYILGKHFTGNGILPVSPKGDSFFALFHNFRWYFSFANPINYGFVI